MSTPSSRPALTLGAVAVTLLLWASAFVAIRDLGERVGPGELSLGRLAVGSLVLGAMLVVARLRGVRLRWPAGRDWLLVVVCGVAWFGVYNVALNAAERLVDAGTAALIIQIGPLLVALGAAVLLGERLHRWLVAGLVVGFAGVALIAQGSSEAHTLDPAGVALALLAAAMYAVGVLCQKPLLRRVGGLELTFCACTVGAVACLPWAGGLADVTASGGWGDLGWIVFLGAFPTAIAFSTWAYALARTDAGTLALTTFLVPAITTLLAWALLDEVPPLLSFVGGALAIAGVLLTRRTPPVVTVPSRA